MKKLALFLCLALVLPCVASAGGLPSIGGGLPNIAPAPAGDAGVLPDPADLLGEGTVFAEDYPYAGILCTVYLYKIPGNVNGFLGEYQALAQANGFAVESTQVEGFQALSMTYGGKKALLFPEYSGSTMLMVENGMIFGEPLPEGNYVQFTRNGRKISPVSSISCKKEWVHDAMYYIQCWFDESPIDLFDLKFPDYVQTGDEFLVKKGQLMNSIYLYTDTDGLLISYDSSSSPNYGFKNSDDFFRIKITKVEKTSGSILIEGTFEGSFNRGEVVYEDGSFRVTCDR